MFTVPENSIPSSEIIEKAIAFNESKRIRYDRLYNYYYGLHAIINRKKQKTLKNNKIMVNHAKYITDLNVGYLLGNPVEYQFEDDAKADGVLEQYEKQTIADLDNEIAKDTSIFGTSYDYTYVVEGTNDLHTKCIDPRNCIIVYDNTLEHKKLFAIIYSARTTLTNNKTAPNAYTYQSLKVIDSENIYEYSEDVTKIETTTPHKLTFIPVIEYRNNPEEKGDFEDVISLIDAYNIFQSDRVNDKEQLVEAILMLYGFTLTDKQRETLKESRMISGLPGKGAQGAGASAEYLTKQLNETDADTLRQVIEADIHKISMTPNMSDKEFVGNSSGVAIKYKLLPFEQNTINKERNFERGLKQRFIIYSYYLNALGLSDLLEAHQIDAIFKRNLPQNDLETAQMINLLRGTVTDKTLVAQLSFVTDATTETEDAQKESLDRMVAAASNFGTDQPNGGNKDNTQGSNETTASNNKAQTTTK